MGLDSTRALLAELGDPQNDLSVVLVGGTNGKGSTAAMLASIATAAGYRSGLYTSPHLEDARERIRVDGVAITTGSLRELLERVVDAAQRATGRLPTYFEAFTAAAFLHLRESEVDLAVMEVGLGGRLDATNVAEPVLSVVTSISRDHTELLGEDLAEIAREKAGIFRPGRPALTGARTARAVEALWAEAERIGADFDPTAGVVGGNWVVTPDLEPPEVTLRTPRAEFDVVFPLLGAHQLDNLLLTVTVAERLYEEGWTRIDSEAIRRGVERFRWPGRLEVIANPRGGVVLLDAAHNEGAIAELAETLSQRARRFTLLFGVLSDKPGVEMLEALARPARRAILTRPETPRAWWPAAGTVGEVEQIEGIPDALSAALEGDPDLVVACGSIYLVGPLRRELRARWPKRVRPAVRPLFAAS